MAERCHRLEVGGGALMRAGRTVIMGLAALWLSACAGPKEADAWVPVGFSELPHWESDQHGLALDAFKRSCEASSNVGGQPFSPPLSLAAWEQACAGVHAVNPADAKQFFERHFTPYQWSDASEGLFTGYYVIALDAQRTCDADYRYPIFTPPAGEGLNLTRQQVDQGALKGVVVPLACVRDPVARYFLHIQGSGVLRFTDGTTQWVGFAAHSPHDYVSIGKILIEREVIAREDMSAPALMHWMQAHPQEAMELMWQNPRMVYFRLLDKEAAIGAQGVPLTPGRSVAVDKRFIPYGLPLWLDSHTPPMPGADPQPLRRLVIAQDTGGAIRGAQRGDIFWGDGALAANLAGYMQSGGRWWVLVPREVE